MVVERLKMECFCKRLEVQNLFFILITAEQFQSDLAVKELRCIKSTFAFFFRLLHQSLFHVVVVNDNNIKEEDFQQQQ